MFKKGEKIDFEFIKDYIKSIINDKKKRDKVILAILVIFILGIIIIKNDNLQIDITEQNDETLINYQLPEEKETMIYVDISGEVLNPGVYMVDSSTRLFQVISLAGGLTSFANVNSINQAELVYDGQKIIVPSIKNDESMYEQQSTNGNGKISINSADLAALQTLPGIGATKAQRIIEYRNKNGRFKSLDELKNVSGIGESTYASIKDLICL